MKTQKGFTLIELLIAAGIMALLLGALAAMFSGTIRAYRVNERLSDAHQNMEATMQLLKYEIALAGYRGTDTDAGTRSFSPLATLEVPASSDAVTVRFFEDRYVTSPVLRTATFTVEDRALVRKEGDGSAVPIAEGVTKLEVVKYLLQNGSSRTTPPQYLQDLAGLTLALTFNNSVPRDPAKDVTKEVTIALHNAQE